MSSMAHVTKLKQPQKGGKKNIEQDEKPFSCHRTGRFQGEMHHQPTGRPWSMGGYEAGDAYAVLVCWRPLRADGCAWVSCAHDSPGA